MKDDRVDPDSSPQTDIAARPASRRRAWLMGGVAAVAGLSGATLAWRRLQADAGLANDSEALWMRSFDSPAGVAFSMEGLRGKPLLINFWATWCPPCIEELPLLEAFYQQHKLKSWQVLGLAVDQPSSVRNFLIRNPLSFPIGMAGLEGTELVKSLGNANGGLPFSVVLDSAGTIRYRRMGRVSEADLTAWAASI